MSKNLMMTEPDGPAGAYDDDAASEQSEARMRESLAMLSAKNPQQRGAQQRPSQQRNSQHNSPQPGSPQSRGGNAAAGTRRHRFVQDGEVPVVHVSRNRDGAPAAAVEPAQDDSHRLLTEQRLALRQHERALDAAQTTIRGLQTRLGNTELALADADDRAKSAAAAIAALRAQLQDEQAALAAERLALARSEQERRTMRAMLDEARGAPAGVTTDAGAAKAPRVLKPRAARSAGLTAKPENAAAEKPVAARRGRPPRAAKEPQPVKWWLTAKAK